MAQNSNISISSGAARFINVPIGRKKRAVSGKKPETYRLTHREENKAKKRPQTAPTVSFWETALSLFPGSSPLTSAPGRL